MANKSGKRAKNLIQTGKKQYLPSNHAEALVAGEESRSGQGSHGLFAGVDQIGVNLESKFIISFKIFNKDDITCIR